MTDHKIISRASLYDLQSDYESDSSEYIAPKLDLEFIEVDSNDDIQQQDDDDDDDESTNVDNDKKGVNVENEDEDKDKVEDEDEDEFEFPLFATAIEPTKTEEEGTGLDTDKNMDSDRRGRSKQVGIMKVSLREQSEERIINERPENYYFAKYTNKEREQFQQSCITADDIYQQLNYNHDHQDTQPWKCIDLKSYNAKIEIELQKEKQRKEKNRPGKKKRQVKVICRQRKLEIAKLKKAEEDAKKKLLKKQRYQKKNFGKFNNDFKKGKPKSNFGKKPQQLKRKGDNQLKPKYRTE